MAEIRYKKEEWKKKMKIKLDVNNMFTEQVGAEHGIKKEDIDKLQDDLLKAHKAIKRARKAGELGFMELPETQKEVAKDIKELVATKKDDFDNFVVLGIGGSALGAIALQTALNHPYYNLNDDARGDGLRLFVPDNVDPARLEGLLETLD